MESNGFSTATSSGNLVHSALSSEPFLTNSSNSSVKQDTSFHISNSNPSSRFLPNQQFSDSRPLRAASASATLGSASYQNPISMSTCFQKSVPKLQTTEFDGSPLDWIQWFSVFQATIDRSPVIIRKDDTSSIAINWRGKVFNRWVRLQRWPVCPSVESS